MWFIPSRKRNQKKKEQDAQAAEGSEEQLLVDQDGNLYSVTVDEQKVKQLLEEKESDSLEELFQGEYDQAVVDEIREYEKPAWEEEVSSLDPVSDIDEYVTHGFNIPPEVYDRLQKEGKTQLRKLEKLRKPLDADEQALVEQRIDLVKHTSLEDVKWLKHKAYYRSMEKIRAEKAQKDKAAREAYLASKGVPLDVVPADVLDAPSAMQQPQQRRHARDEATEKLPDDISQWYKPIGASVAELVDLQRAAEPSETSEWQDGWDTLDYLHHDDARRRLFNAFNQAFNPGAPLAQPAPEPGYPTEGEVSEDVEQQQLVGAALSERKQQFLVSSVSGDAESKYTPEFLAIRRVQQQVQQQAAQQRQAFVLSFAGALGAVLVRQLVRALRRPGGKPGGGSSSSSRSPSVASSLAAPAQ